jgi:hypothetical protein
MARLLCGTTILIVVFTVAILAARLVGSRDTTPPLLLLFTNADGSPCQHPCLFGAMPGRMTRDEMVAALKRHPITHSMADFPNAIAYGGFEARGMTILVGTIGGRIDLRVGDPRYDRPELPAIPEWLYKTGSFSLGNVVTALGPPDAETVSVWNSAPALYTVYSARQLSFVYRCVPAGWITSDAVLLAVQVDPPRPAEAGYRPWSGFGEAGCDLLHPSAER